jgi:histone deacetylase 1/2
MVDTQAAGDSSTAAALTSASTAALISEIASAAATAAASNSNSGHTQNINIKSLIPITLDMESNSYRRWRSTFRIILGRFDLLSHIDTNTPRPDDSAWVQADLTVLMWLHATLADDLMDMVLEDKPTAYSVWRQIAEFFTNNKPSRAVQLEAEFHGLKQGDLSASAYCHRLKTLADALADCDQPLRPRALVHQLVAGLHPRYHTLKTMIPALPQFPSFIQARTMLLAEEASQDANKQSSTATDTALIATEGGSTTGEQSGTRQDSGERTSSNTSGGRSGGRGNGGGGRNGGRGRGRGRGGGRGHQNYNTHGGYGGRQMSQTPNWQAFFSPWGAPWGAGWRAPWTGATGPGVNNRPPHQAYNAFSQPTTTSAPATWDTTGLMQALHAASLQQPSTGEWFMDTGASTHMTGEQGNLPDYCPSSLQNSSHIVVGNGSTLPVIGTGNTSIRTPHKQFLLSNVLHTPHLIKNLVSVRKFTKDNSCSVEFDPTGFSVKDLQTRKELMRSTSGGDLYSFGPTKIPTPMALTASNPSSVVWHRRLGHPGHLSLAHLISQFSLPCTHNNTPSGVCDACQRGRHVRLPFATSQSVTYFPFQIIHCDLWTSPIVSFTGYKYYLVLLDDYSHYTWTFPLRHKSDTVSTIQHFYAYVLNQFHLSIQCVQCDNGSEFVNNTLRDFFVARGITYRLSCPYTSSQNGKAERSIRTINDVIRTLLLQAHMPTAYWVEALHTATYLINRRPSKPLQLATPYERLFLQPPDYSHLRIFGCLCYPNILPTTPHKLAPRSTRCAFLGYSADHKGYRCLDLTTHKVIISRHVIFDENQFPFELQQSSAAPAAANPSASIWDLLPAPPPATLSMPTPTAPRVPPMGGPQSTTAPIPSPASRSPPRAASPPHPGLTSPTAARTPPATTQSTSRSTPAAPMRSAALPRYMHPTKSTQHHMITRAKQGIFVPKRQFNLIATTSVSPIPHTYRSALKDPNWHNAMTDEFNALIKNNTWSLVPKPAGVNVISGKWVYRIKYNHDGTISRYKARWVVRGCSQQSGVDYGETFSPVIKPATIRTILSIATASSWPIHQLDVKNAFLHGTLSETVYCAQPSGFVDPSRPSHVCKLHKSLYGLKQAPRTWFLRFKNFIISLGYQASKADSSLFILKTPTATSYILLYVDDIILTASSTSLLHSVISKLQNEFSMTDLGPLSHFLGIHVTPSPSGLYLSQEQYIHDLLSRANMTNCNPCTTPVDTKPKLASSGSRVANASEYRSLAGALQYLTITRPDISYAVQQICLFMHDPRAPHLQLLKRVLRYLRGTMNYGLHINKSASSEIVAYSDADWAGCPDTRRSTSGYCVFIGNNLVAWSSKRQPTVSRSSAEAEYRAVANAVSETCWLRQLLHELGHPPRRATIVYCDNVSAQYLSTNPVQHQRTKHVEIDLHFVREKVALGEVKVQHVPSSSQFADIFTKGLPRVLHDEFRRSLNIHPRPG